MRRRPGTSGWRVRLPCGPRLSCLPRPTQSPNHLRTCTYTQTGLRMHWLRSLRQRQRGAHVSFEQPPRCASWQKARVKAMLRDCRMEIAHFPSCSWGLRDPFTAEPFFKLQGFACTRSLAHLVRPCTCQDGHHAVVQGQVKGGSFRGQARSRLAGRYPEDLCTALAAVVHETVRSGR